MLNSLWVLLVTFVLLVVVLTTISASDPVIEVATYIWLGSWALWVLLKKKP